MDTVNQVLPLALLALVGVMFFFLERGLFNRIALAAFLAVEKELSTAEGRDKFAVAVEKILDTLPSQLKGALNLIAHFTGKTLHELIELLAQKTYDLIFRDLHPQI